MAAGNRHSDPSSDAFRDRRGIAKSKAAGVYKGRPASIDASQVRAMRAQRLASEIAKALKIGRASVYPVSEAGQ
jgi:DNA invertase Pin-like site-specific DNA recombinase